MSDRPLPRPTPQTPFVSVCTEPAFSALRTASRNHLLGALPPSTYGRLLPYLEPVSLPRGWTVHHAGDPEKYLYFVTDGIISRCYLSGHGNFAAIALTGREGVIGLASVMGGESALSEVAVLSPGYAYRLDAHLLNRGLEDFIPLQKLLLRYSMLLIAQVGQTAACYRHHSIEQQLCRWILACLDRLPSNELTMTQDMIAHMLGVRREGITEAAQVLQRAGLIHYKRGHIAVVDRPALETRVCECYAVVKRVYDHMLPAHGASDGQPVARIEMN
jgi:CRP-like cAMP-binding protein